MATIIDYVAQETRDFSEYPFHVADALVYAILSYDKIPQEVPQLSSLLECFGSISSKLRNFNLKHPSRSLAALWRTPFPGPTLREVEERLHEYELTHPYWEHHSGFSDDDETPHRFYRSIKRNPRFAVTRMSAAEERFDISQQTQYAAETFQLPDGTLLVAFRGTDDSLTGWREDFNMAFTYPVPAQKQAADYLEKVGRLWPNARIMLTGHSKGGNIAIYAAMNARDQIKDRIERIYAFDSPGFNQDVHHRHAVAVESARTYDRRQIERRRPHAAFLLHVAYGRRPLRHGSRAVRELARFPRRVEHLAERHDATPTRAWRGGAVPRALLRRTLHHHPAAHGWHESASGAVLLLCRARQ